MLIDFITYQSIDPTILLGMYSNYASFLENMKEEVSPLTDYEQQVLTMISQEIIHGKRKHELLLLEYVLMQKEVTCEQYESYIREHNCMVNDKILASVQRIFDLSFFTEITKRKYGNTPIILR